MSPFGTDREVLPVCTVNVRFDTALYPVLDLGGKADLSGTTTRRISRRTWNSTGTRSPGSSSSPFRVKPGESDVWIHRAAAEKKG